LNYFLKKCTYTLAACAILPIFLAPCAKGTPSSKYRVTISAPCCKTPKAQQRRTTDATWEEAEAISQKEADRFVLEYWKGAYPNPRNQLKVCASDEMDHLQNAYWKNCLVKRGPKGQLFPTCNFTVSQVYAAYYRAVSAERIMLANMTTD
jgi:hypothetical protein